MEALFQPHTDKTLPMIHVYCFQNPAGAEEVVPQEIRKALGFEIPGSELTIHNVRNVSPNKVQQ
jgi:tRNA (guanine37-N1)-methyltransferase